jgi:hypothetical protein
MTMDASTNPRYNQLLAALPHDQWKRWQSHLEHVDMPLGQVLYEPNDTLSHVYFPTTAIVSLLYVMGAWNPAGRSATAGPLDSIVSESLPMTAFGLLHRPACGRVRPDQQTRTGLSSRFGVDIHYLC